MPLRMLLYRRARRLWRWLVPSVPAAQAQALRRALRQEVRSLALACEATGVLIWLMTLMVSGPGGGAHLSAELLCTAAAGLGMLLSLRPRPPWLLSLGGLMVTVSLAIAFRLNLEGSAAQAFWTLPLLMLFGMCLALCHVRLRDFLAGIGAVGLVFVDGALMRSVAPAQRPVLAFFAAGALTLCLLAHLALSRERRSGHVLQLRLAALAYEDVLTGLPNRRAFLERTQAALAAMPAGVFNVVLLDVDDFKRINERLGHEGGDRALRAVAQALRGASAPHLCARLGGEEFCIWIEDASASPADVAAACVSAVHHLRVDGLRLSVSAGVATVEPDVPLHRALALADEALYQAKARGKDTLAVAPPSGRMPLIPAAPERRTWRPWRALRRP
ncbi:GGDEF domain-containing protein [Pseudacidovorax sp. NFM-22]|uniref:GGDEF domain-containing protein n=1 Tax=Pseudacidovorax sp. NFM-22 TaxID=2744469 RepID=UPI001F1608DA|nr:GGDEF domain-containing protein [Pseudacidovorax sp. NFM-22]